MTYTLTWTPDLELLYLVLPMGGNVQLTPTQWGDKYADDPALIRYRDYAMDHPNQPVDWSPLPN